MSDDNAVPNVGADARTGFDPSPPSTLVGSKPRGNVSAGSVPDDTTPVFDPADHTVEEVNDHLADADDAEQARVLEAERGGKARVGVLGEDA